jgi:hypothetical protein
MTMQKQIRYIIPMVAALLALSCKKDNYSAPGSTLKGRIVYKGEPINVSFNDVSFELWESGWGKSDAIDVTVSPDGSYAAQLFDASYKLIIPPYQGPFRSIPNSATHSDTVIVNLTGSQTMDIEVLPYYMIREPKFSLSGNKVEISCKLEQIIKDANAREIERVSLYLGKSVQLDGRTSLSSKDMDGAEITDPGNVRLSADVPGITPAQNYLFARIGLKIRGVEDMLFSPVQQIDLK